MIVITGCQRVGTLMQGYDVLRATTFQILPIARNTNNLSSQQLDDEQKYVQLLENHLRSNGFYFSYRYNVTLSIQKQAYLADKGRDYNWRDVCLTRYTHPRDTNVYCRQMQDSSGTDILVRN